MDDNRKWHLAWAKLDAFSNNLPPSIREKHVIEFHAILDLLKEASGEDTAPFRISDDELKRKLTGMVPGMPRTATYTDDKYCDANLMLRRVNEGSKLLRKNHAIR